MRAIWKIGFLLVAIGLGTGCHKEPKPTPVIDKDVNVHISSIYLNLTSEIYLIPYAASKADPLKICIRLEVYENGGLVAEDDLVEDIREDNTYTTDLVLPLKNHAYTLAVWAAYADEEGHCTYYHSDQLTRIRPREPYCGNLDTKDAFSLTQALDLKEYEGDVPMNLTLERPFAKYRIVANDLDAYREETGATPEQIQAITVRLSYAGFFPYGYNALTGKPNDALTGISFEGCSQLCDEGLTLAFDYVWVNGAASSVDANLVIYDHTGAIINTVGGITIPYQRNKQTTIQGDFLTRRPSGGVVIDPRFSGEFNIEID